MQYDIYISFHIVKQAYILKNGGSHAFSANLDMANSAFRQ